MPTFFTYTNGYVYNTLQGRSYLKKRNRRTLMSARIGRGRAGRLFAERKRRLFLPSPRLLPRLQPRPFYPVRCGNPKPPVPLIWCQNSSGRSDGANVSKGCLYSVIVQPLDARTVLAKLAFVYTATHTHTHHRTRIVLSLRLLLRALQPVFQKVTFRSHSFSSVNKHF